MYILTKQSACHEIDKERERERDREEGREEGILRGH
jgi:hypothetical protein